jgi:hypothetical protein
VALAQDIQDERMYKMKMGILQQFPILLSTDINDKNLVVQASCLHKVYLTQSELAVLYSELLAAALRYRCATFKVFTNGALLFANTPYYLAV